MRAALARSGLKLTSLLALCGALGIVPLDGRAADEASAAKYHAYWLTGASSGEYVDLLLSRRPIAELAGLAEPADRDPLDCQAVVVRTYARDSIWNTDRRPVKPLAKVGKVSDGRIMIEGREFQWAPAPLEDAARLMEQPEGRVMIHRLHRASDGQEALIDAFAKRLRAQAGPNR